MYSSNYTRFFLYAPENNRVFPNPQRPSHHPLILGGGLTFTAEEKNSQK
jgi:hypothetical protein